MEDRIGHIILRIDVASSFAFHIKHIVVPKIVISQTELIALLRLYGGVSMLVKCAEFVGGKNTYQRCIHTQSTVCSHGELAASEKVPEESGSLEAAGQLHIPARQAGAQGA